MKTVFYELLPKSELRRIERIEIFDEFEEFHLMMQHYALTLAVKTDGAEADVAALVLARLPAEVAADEASPPAKVVLPPNAKLLGVPQPSAPPTPPPPPSGA